ncbi:MAG: hypothetical protein ACXAB5_07565 [Candidatus Thorarchaeota archaeon]|jgi:hypothetical protein
MSGARKRRGLLQELERTENVLEVLLTRLSNLNSSLQPIERELRVTDFVSSGVYVQGASRGIVCVLSGLIKGDPVERVLNEKSGSGIPALIKAGDRSESQSTIESIVNMVHAEGQKKPVEFIVNLRWSVFPGPIEKENIMIVGTRYLSGKPSEVKRLKAELEKLGVDILEDDGEYGGGPLVYAFIKSFKNKPEPLVIELTLSHKLSKNLTLVTGILNVLAAF